MKTNNKNKQRKGYALALALVAIVIMTIGALTYLKGTFRSNEESAADNIQREELKKAEQRLQNFKVGLRRFVQSDTRGTVHQGRYLSENLVELIRASLDQTDTSLQLSNNEILSIRCIPGRGSCSNDGSFPKAFQISYTSIDPKLGVSTSVRQQVAIQPDGLNNVAYFVGNQPASRGTILLSSTTDVQGRFFVFYEDPASGQLKFGADTTFRDILATNLPDQSNLGFSERTLPNGQRRAAKPSFEDGVAFHVESPIGDLRNSFRELDQAPASQTFKPTAPGLEVNTATLTGSALTQFNNHGPNVNVFFTQVGGQCHLKATYMNIQSPYAYSNYLTFSNGGDSSGAAGSSTKPTGNVLGGSLGGREGPAEGTDRVLDKELNLRWNIRFAPLLYLAIPGISLQTSPSSGVSSGGIISGSSGGESGEEVIGRGGSGISSSINTPTVSEVTLFDINVTAESNVPVISIRGRPVDIVAAPNQATFQNCANRNITIMADQGMNIRAPIMSASAFGNIALVALNNDITISKSARRLDNAGTLLQGARQEIQGDNDFEINASLAALNGTVVLDPALLEASLHPLDELTINGSILVEQSPTFNISGLNTGTIFRGFQTVNMRYNQDYQRPERVPPGLLAGNTADLKVVDLGAPIIRYISLEDSLAKMQAIAAQTSNDSAFTPFAPAN